MMKTIKQCSELSGLPYHLIRKWCLENKVKHIKSGTKYYVNFQNLMELING